MSAKAKIRAAKDLIREGPLVVPEWDIIESDQVYVRTLSGVELDRWEAGNVEGEGKDRKANLRNIRARFVALCLVQEDGARLFTDQEADELGSEHSGRVLDRLFDLCQKLNGKGEANQEEIRKNLLVAPNGVSGTKSPVA